MRPSRCSVGLLALTFGGVAACGGAAAPRPLRAQSVAEPQGAAFLLLPVGARAVGMGQAAAAEGGSTEAVFWNPAGLASVPRGEFAVHHFNAFFGTGDAIAVAARSQRLGAVALAAYLVDYGDLDLTSKEGGAGGVIGRITPRNVALSLSYATDVATGVSFGVTYKLVQLRVDCSGDCSSVPHATGTTHGVDVGARFSSAAAPLTIGVALRNVGFPLQVENSAQADALPTRLSFGVAYQVVQAEPGEEAQSVDLRVIADIQGDVGRGSFSPATLLGVESGVGDMVRLRGGYAFLDSEASGPSIGLGMRLGGISFDLARVFSASDNLSEREPVHVSFRAAF